MAGIQISGLSSGIDSKAIIDAMVKSESAPITKLNAQSAALAKQKTTFSSLTSQISSLTTMLSSMKQSSGIAAKKAASSDTAVGVAVSGAAQAGSFDVSVSKLAASFKTYSDPVSSRDTAGVAGTGNISVKVGSKAAVDIEVTADMTLDDIADKIRASDENLTVGVVYDGGAYRLQVSNTQTGEANDVQIVETGTTLNLNGASNVRSRGQDAEFSIDGIAMKRSTNTVDDALAGVTIALTKTTSTPSTITVTNDPDGMKTKIQSFVDAYNAIVGTVNTQNAGTPGDLAKLRNDPTLQSLTRNLSAALSTVTPGAGAFNTLSSIGIGTSKDGTLTVNADKLNAALAKDPTSVSKLFADNPSTGVKGLATRLNDIAGQYGGAAGAIATRVQGIETRVKTIGINIDRIQTKVDAYRAQLEAKYAALESTVSQWKNYGSGVTSKIGYRLTDE